MPTTDIQFSQATGLGLNSSDPAESKDETDSLSSDELWQDWAKTKDKAKLRKVVNSFRPITDRVLTRYGSSAGGTVRGKADLFVARAIQSYKPGAGANLKTHVYNSLKSLQRSVPMLTDPMPIPERIRLESNRIRQVAAEFEGNIGRPPSDEELADLTKLSPKKLQRIRAMAKGRLPFSTIEEADDDNAESDIIGSTRTDYDNWVDAVYSELGETDKLIMQHRSGYNGSDRLDNNAIAEKLDVSPAYVSQRALAIQRRLDAYHG